MPLVICDCGIVYMKDPVHEIVMFLALWIIYYVSCVFHAFASVLCCLVVTCWERADLLALVCDVNCIL